MRERLIDGSRHPGSRKDTRPHSKYLKARMFRMNQTKNVITSRNIIPFRGYYCCTMNKWDHTFQTTKPVSKSVHVKRSTKEMTSKKFGTFRAGNKESLATPLHFRHIVTQFCKQFRLLALFLMRQYYLHKKIYTLWQNLVEFHEDLKKCLTYQVKNWPRLFCYNIKNSI